MVEGALAEMIEWLFIGPRRIGSHTVMAKQFSGCPMFDPRASQFWQATIRSGLMDVESLTACLGCDRAHRTRCSGAQFSQASEAGSSGEIADFLAGSTTACGPTQWIQD